MISDYLKATGCVLISVILYTLLSKHEKHLALTLSIAACALTAVIALRFLSPALDFFYTLQKTAKIDSSLLSVVLRSVGIGLLAEITGVICTDSGNAALGKTLQILSGAVILCLSLPLLKELLDLVQTVLGKV